MGQKPDYIFLTEATRHLLDHVDPDVFDFAIRPASLDAFLAAEGHGLVMAVQDGLVVGFASSVIILHPDKTPELFVNELGVAERCQRRGIGQDLLTALLDKGRAQGCTAAWVAADLDAAAAEALYAKMGGELSAGHNVYIFRL